MEKGQSGMGRILPWVHVICAVTWIGSSACAGILGSAFEPDERKNRELVRRVFALVVFLSAFTAAAVLLSGSLMLMRIVGGGAYPLPKPFWRILAVKATLFLTMVAILVGVVKARRNDLGLQAEADARLDRAIAQLRRIAGLCSVSALLGMIALVMGIWLAGTL